MKVMEIKIQAKEGFSVNRYYAMLVYCIVFTLLLNISVITYAVLWYGIALFVLFWIFYGPIQFSMTSFYLMSYRHEKADPLRSMDGFAKGNFERSLILYILRGLFILLFTILLIVPGIIYAVKTSMAAYLLRANPKMKPSHALRSSGRIMRGNSLKFFGLVMSFTGWFFIGILTLGIGFIWLAPYYNMSKVVFYKRILQGDKNSYVSGKTVEEFDLDKQSTSYGSTSDGEIDSEGKEDDEKNIAAQLIKLQLNEEIKNLDERMRSISRERAMPTITNPFVENEKIDKSNKTEKVIASEKEELPNIKSEVIYKTTDRVVEKPLNNTDHVKTITRSVEHVFDMDNGFISDEREFDDEVSEVSNLIKTDSSVQEVALPIVNTADSEKTETRVRPQSSSVKIDKEALVTRTLDKEKTITVEKATPGADSRESIKQKIEQLKQEREIRRQNLTKNAVSYPKTIADAVKVNQKKKAKDEFAPEKIEIEEE